ncbi:ABC transporter substrate-binding protein [Fluviispira multicolorata]|nr:ABC transporter substrate binding protein [Fluviispira multicolorata]
MSAQVFAKKQKKILIIESYHKEFKWDSDYRKSISDYLKANYTLSFFEMNTKKISKQNYENVAQSAWEYSLDYNPDLVILGDDTALSLLGERFEHAKIPTVYLGIKSDPKLYFDKDPLYITGIYAKPLVLKTAQYLKEILPKTKRALILFDKSKSSEVLYQEILKNINNNYVSGILFQVETIENFINWQSLVLNARRNFDVIIVGLYQYLKGENGNEIDSEEVMKWTSKFTPVPVFGLWDNSVGKEKAIGGLVVSSSAQGYEAAKMAEKILIYPHVLPKSIPPVYVEEGSVLFSKFQLKKWRIKLSKNLVHDASFID